MVPRELPDHPSKPDLKTVKLETDQKSMARVQISMWKLQPPTFAFNYFCLIGLFSIAGVGILKCVVTTLKAGACVEALDLLDRL